MSATQKDELQILSERVLHCYNRYDNPDIYVRYHKSLLRGFDFNNCTLWLMKDFAGHAGSEFKIYSQRNRRDLVFHGSCGSDGKYLSRKHESNSERTGIRKKELVIL